MISYSFSQKNFGVHYYFSLCFQASDQLISFRSAKMNSASSCPRCSEISRFRLSFWKDFPGSIFIWGQTTFPATRKTWSQLSSKRSSWTSSLLIWCRTRRKCPNSSTVWPQWGSECMIWLSLGIQTQPSLINGFSWLKSHCYLLPPFQFMYTFSWFRLRSAWFSLGFWDRTWAYPSSPFHFPPFWIKIQHPYKNFRTRFHFCLIAN